MDFKDKTCPICYDDLDDNIVGRLSCKCLFCFKCIAKQSKLSNRCPLDRHSFHSIEIFVDNEIFCKAPVRPAQPNYPRFDYEIIIVCEICKICDLHLFKCSACSLFYHHSCVWPNKPITSIDNWLCPTCAKVLKAEAAKGMENTNTQKSPPSASSSPTLEGRTLALLQSLFDDSISQPSTSSVPVMTSLFELFDPERDCEREIPSSEDDTEK